MDRRKFLRNTGLVSTALLMPRFLQAMPNATGTKGRILVVVQLTGGNDGLNTVVPYRNDVYYRERPVLGITKDKVLPLTDELGLHPAMSGLRELFDQGLVTVINGVGYPQPDRSHFRSMDIWHTASGSDQYLGTGWLGRYLDATDAPPHGVIEFGGALSLANKGLRTKAIALNDPRSFHAATREPYFAALAQEQHQQQHVQLGYLYRTMAETYRSAGYIHETLRPQETSASWPKHDLARQLKQVSSFIRSGMATSVYYTSTDGFDTHVNQAMRHEKLLGAVSASLSAFMADMKAAGRGEEVLVMVFSEFGRRVKQNANNGTDHGTSSNVLLLGGALRKPGIHNPLPALTALDENGDLPHSVDFRSIYAALLSDWIGMGAAGILDTAIRPIPLVK
jgi:uncharacterized protein (DUF1501 family)